MHDYTTRFYYQGETIFTEGMSGDTAYLVKSGRVNVFRTVAGEQVPLAEFGPGEIFGEMAVLLPGPRTATAQMAEAGDLIVLPKQRVTELLDEVPLMVKTLFQSVMERLQVTTQRLRPIHEVSTFLAVSRILALELHRMQAMRLKGIPYREAIRTVMSILPVSAAEVEEVLFKLQDLGLIVCHKNGIPSKSVVFLQIDGFLAACERHYDQYADHLMEQHAHATVMDLDVLPEQANVDPQALLVMAARAQLPLGLLKVDRQALTDWLKAFPDQAADLRVSSRGTPAADAEAVTP